MKENNQRLKRNRRLANAALLLAAFIWGTAFVAQSLGMDSTGPFTFQWVRSFVGVAALLPVIWFMDHKRKKRETRIQMDGKEKKKLIAGGICCGSILFVAGSFQQAGIQYTSVGNAGFITSMYMILVPVLSIFLRKKVRPKIWFCVVLSATGMYFLSISETLKISKGDTLVAVCAFFFALHILAVDYFAPQVDGVKLSCLQFAVVGMLSVPPAFLFEKPDAGGIAAAILPILYAGVLSSGVAYTLQIVGQQYAQPAVATLLMSMESVFALLGGMVMLRQIPTVREFFGCALVFIAVLISQINLKKV